MAKVGVNQKLKKRKGTSKHQGIFFEEILYLTVPKQKPNMAPLVLKGLFFTTKIDKLKREPFCEKKNIFPRTSCTVPKSRNFFLV